MSSSTTTSHYLSPSDVTDDSRKPVNAKKASKSPYQNNLSTTTYDTEKIALSNPAASTSTLGSTDPRTQDIKSWGAGFERMQDERLEKQRYTMSGKKGDEVSIAALGAKVERALGRRMVGQDAVFTARRQADVPVELPEKRSLELKTSL